MDEPKARSGWGAADGLGAIDGLKATNGPGAVSGPVATDAPRAMRDRLAALPEAAGEQRQDEAALPLLPDAEPQWNELYEAIRQAVLSMRPDEGGDSGHERDGSKGWRLRDHVEPSG